jgi:hypothetical protein
MSSGARWGLPLLRRAPGATEGTRIEARPLGPAPQGGRHKKVLPPYRTPMRELVAAWF